VTYERKISFGSRRKKRVIDKRTFGGELLADLMFTRGKNLTVKRETARICREKRKSMDEKTSFSRRGRKKRVRLKERMERKGSRSADI